jgi:hypothetical protein
MQTVASALKSIPKPEIANMNLLRQVEWLKSNKVKKIFSGRCSVSTNHESCVLALNYRDREKILLAMPFDPAKSGGHEVCSSVHPRLHCVCIANICGLATALSGKTGATL